MPHLLPPQRLIGGGAPRLEARANHEGGTINGSRNGETAVWNIGVLAGLLCEASGLAAELDAERLAAMRARAEESRRFMEQKMEELRAQAEARRVLQPIPPVDPETAKAAQAARWARARQEFALWLNPGLHWENGTITSTEAWREKTTSRLLEFAGAADAKQARLTREAEDYARQHALPMRLLLADGGEAKLTSIEGGVPRFLATQNANAARSVLAHEVHPGGGTGLNLTGQGMRAGMWDVGSVDPAHHEFTNSLGETRIIAGMGSGGISSHATHVGGTLIAAGVHAAAQGMLPQANLVSYYELGVDDERMKLEATRGVRVSNHSYGSIVGWAYDATNDIWWWFGDIALSEDESYKFGYYSDQAPEMDHTVCQVSTLLPVWAAGNERAAVRGHGPPDQPVWHRTWLNGFPVETNLFHPDDGDVGGYDTLPPEGVAKNVLTVGAVEDVLGSRGPENIVMSEFSSFGPTDDGRIKPDVVANGVALYSTATNGGYAVMSGTSMAAPNAAGALLLPVQLQDDYWGKPFLASTVKGLAIHTADEAGDAPGPDYRFGWGLVNVSNAVELWVANYASQSAAHIKEVYLFNGDHIEFPVVSDGTQPLKVTICWTDPPPDFGPPRMVDPTNHMLVNDLDLRVIRAATTNYPWILDPASPAAPARTGDNVRDNVEQVVISNPVPGEYLVRIDHKGQLIDLGGDPGFQPVSILISGNVAQPAPALQLTRIAFTGSDELTVEWQSVVGWRYQVPYADDVVPPVWTDIGPEVSATKPLTALPLYVEGPLYIRHRFYRVVGISY